MRFHPYRSHIAGVLALLLMTAEFPIPLLARPKPSPDAMVVMPGQPNVYSLEQAHYLLERNRRRNGQLQSRDLGDLDPNEATATRAGLLRTLLSVSVDFDRAAGIKNQEALRQYRDNATPRRSLLQDRQDAARSELTDINKSLAAAEKRKAELLQLGAKPTDDSVVAVTGTIAELKSQQAARNSEIESLNKSLEGLPSGPNITGVSATPANPQFSDILAKDLLSKMLNDLDSVQPKLGASVRLDNYIQMQYELIAKQLTLLRDEAGPNNRVLFLELPQSIHAAKDRGERQIAQTWWRLVETVQVHNNDSDHNLRPFTLDELYRRDPRVTTLQRLNWVNQKMSGNSDWEERVKVDVGNLLQSCLLDPSKIEKTLNDVDEQLRRSQARINQLDEFITGSQILDKGLQSTKQAIDALVKQISDVAQRHKGNKDPKPMNDALGPLKVQLESALTKLAEFKPHPVPPSTNLNFEEVARFNAIVSELSELKSRLPTPCTDEQISRVAKETNERLDVGLDGLLDIHSAALTALAAARKARAKSATVPNRQAVSVAESAVEASLANLEKYAAPELRDYRTIRAAPISDDVRTIEIIPRQSAQVISAVNGRFDNKSFVGALRLLTLGVSAKYERARESLEQFTYQDAFSWGFGKGLAEFGWTFGPMPFQKLIASGTRTTYAVVIVPRETEAITLTSRGCWFGDEGTMPGSYPTLPQPNRDTRCSPEKEFRLRVPGQQEGFQLRRIEYSSVSAGERAVVHLYGAGFSPQLQVFVDGFPLEKMVAASEFNKAIPTGNQVSGFYEWVNSGEIMLAFSKGPDDVADPLITLVSPSRSGPINFEKRIHVNNFPFTTLYRQLQAFPMFARSEFSLNRAQLASWDPSTNKVKVHVIGKGLHPTDDFTINTIKTKSADVANTSAQLSTLTIDRPKSSLWAIEAESNEKPNRTSAISIEDPLPPLLKSAKCEVWTANSALGGRYLELKIEAKHFNGRQTPKLEPGKWSAATRIDSSDLLYLAIQELPGGGDTLSLRQNTLTLSYASGGYDASLRLDSCANLSKAVRKEKPADYSNGVELQSN